jgi:ParB family chromosome partitioning protein
MKTPKNPPITVRSIPLEKIAGPTIDMRSENARGRIEDLRDSIALVGLINPILVKKTDDGYEVVAGHRRLRACSELRWQKIPAIVFPRDGMNAELAKLAENQVRESVSPVEEAEFLQAIASAYKLNGQQLAKRINRTASYVSERLALLKAPEALRAAVTSGELSFSSARELSRIRDQQTREVYIDHAIRSGVNDTTAKQWRMDANRASDAGASAQAPGGSQPADNVQRIRVQCALTGQTVAIEHTVLVRISTPVWNTVLTEYRRET